MLLSFRCVLTRRLGPRSFSTSVPLLDRAIVYSSNGAPRSVLRVLNYDPLASPPPQTVNLKFLLAPINPADLNVIEGVYPAKPSPNTSLNPSGPGSPDEPVFVGGNEGLAEVTEVGDGVSELQKGDWVIMTRPQAGTWSTSKNVRPTDVLKVPRTVGDFKVTEVQAATITVNPATAYNMLHGFTSLEKGDWVVQNGANSAVGQAVIQIAASKGINTLNFVRPRDNISSLEAYLKGLGATEVLTYDKLEDKGLRGTVKSWTQGKGMRLALNCVGGQVTTWMTQLLGQDGHLVSYGAMSKQPISLPTSLFIFKNLKAHGFWQSRWYADRSREEQEQLMRTLVGYMSQGKLQAPDHKIIDIAAVQSESAANQIVEDTMSKLEAGGSGKKFLLKL